MQGYGGFDVGCGGFDAVEDSLGCISTGWMHFTEFYIRLCMIESSLVLAHIEMSVLPLLFLKRWVVRYNGIDAGER